MKADRPAKYLLAVQPMLASALETATWGLVLATALLVVATAIPATASLAAHLAERKRRAAEVVPDMHILRSRLAGRISELREQTSIPLAVTDYYIEDCGEMLRMLQPIALSAPRQGLRFTNEVYIARHLLTSAYYGLQGAAADHRRDNGNGDGMVSSDSLAAVLDQLVAVRASLVAAEKQLPASTTTIDGEPFWQRFSRVSHEREKQARDELLRESWNV